MAVRVPAELLEAAFSLCEERAPQPVRLRDQDAAPTGAKSGTAAAVAALQTLAGLASSTVMTGSALCSLARNMYTAGTTNSVNSVPMDRPLKMIRPME